MEGFTACFGDIYGIKRVIPYIGVSSYAETTTGSRYVLEIEDQECTANPLYEVEELITGPLYEKVNGKFHERRERDVKPAICKKVLAI